MDKSPSINCEQGNDGSWDMDDENNEDMLQSMENSSCNSWDSNSEKGGRLENKERPNPEVSKSISDSWTSSISNKNVIKAMERKYLYSDSECAEEIDLPEEKHPQDELEEEVTLFDVVEKFDQSPDPEESCLIEDIEDIEDLKNPREEGNLRENLVLMSSRNSEQCLVVEDLEESVVKNIKSDSGDDASVWKIPISGRTESSDDTDIIVNSGKFMRGKSKSNPNFFRQSNNSKKSKSVDNLPVPEVFSLKDALMQFEGCHIRTVEEKKKEDPIEGILHLGDTATHFQEFECRTLRTNIKLKDEVKREPEHEDSRPNVGTSSKVSEEAVSLPDIAEAGRSDMNGKHEFRKAVSYTTNHNLIRENPPEVLDENLTESWILLDEMGQSQPVTITEVNFLLNGRSADAVLQENKEHFIPKSTVVRNANSDLLVDRWNPLVEESLQHFLNEEDPGGEESASKSIGLERKFGNMLLFIQSGVNLTSSVRFIPVDIEMIHMWRQSKENLSPISSEDDARVAVCENAEETSEYGNHEDVRCRYHDSRAAVRKRRTRQSRKEEEEHRMVENRRIIESLTDDIKQLKMRLEAERNRSSGLEQEIYRLRGQLDKYKSGQSSSDSQNAKSETTEEYKKNSEAGYVPHITSSSLLSIEELRDGNDGKPNLQRSNNSLLSTEDDQKKFKKSLDKNINDIEEILKCKKRDEIKTEQFQTDNSRLSSSASVNTFPVLETTSQVLSETTSDSSFKPRERGALQKDISDIISELEKENENLVTENLNLKKKLNEISAELDEYVSSCVVASPVEENRQTESLRNQVYNLKLELENMKSLAKSREQSFKLKDAIVREELAEKSVSLEEWRTFILNIFSDFEKSREEIGFSTPNPCSEMGKLAPNDLMSELGSLMSQLTAKLLDSKKENSLLKKSFQENLTCNGFERSFDVNFLPKVPNILFGNKNDYSLLADEDEVKNLRKENDLLLEYQIAHNDKLKKMTMALREERGKIESLEKALKIMGIEKEEISEALVAYQKEKAIVEAELQMERTRTAEMKIESEKRRIRVDELSEKLQEAIEKCRSSDEASVVKDEIIKELKNNCNELESRESQHSSKIHFLSDRLKKLDTEKSDLEEELISTKQIAEESSRGMSEYISHLETMVRNAEDNLVEMKEKFNDTLKSLVTLKKTHEDLEKENETNSKSFKRTKEELEECKEVIKDLKENNRKSEETRKKALTDLNAIVKSEREKTETLEKLVTERKMLDDEISTLKMTSETQAREKDRLLKKQKDFINEIAFLRKENEKLGQKYRNVKSECNERTKLLRKLDGKLRENFFEYNKRIACLEKNVSNIIEKAALYKDAFLESRTEANAVVRELQQQLDVAYTEKKGLESEAASFCAAMRHLRKELCQRKKENISDYQKAEETSESADDSESRLKKSEREAQEKIRQLENSKEQDRSKYESIIADLKSQISRYQVRLEVMLKNISVYGKSVQESTDKRELENAPKISSMEQKIRQLNEELEKKRTRMMELTQVIENNEVEMKKKGDECESLKEKVTHLKEEIRNMKNQFSKLQEFLSSVNKNVETYQKERDEVAGKLAKSLKLIVEERASKQSSETVFLEKEKFFKEQIEQLQVRLMEKKNDYEALLKSMEEKKSLINQLQEDVKKWRSEVDILKSQVTVMKEEKSVCQEEAESKQKNAELKEVRAVNLELRKKEGLLQASIVRLEDELRGARLLVKELEGDLKTEKTSKKLLKEMITSAKNEIERFKRGGQIMSSIADKVERHFNLSEVQSRELFSGYRSLLPP